MCVAVDRCASNYTHTHHQQPSEVEGGMGVVMRIRGC